MNKRQRGVTLIEVMIVVVIVGILASVAYPSYTEYVERARRADGQAALLDAAQRMERCYTQNNTYVGCGVPANSPDGFYTLAFNPAPTATTFNITATPLRADTRCGVLSLTSNGSRGATGSRGAPGCW